MSISSPTVAAAAVRCRPSWCATCTSCCARRCRTPSVSVVLRNAAAAARPPVGGRFELVTWSSDDLRQFLAAVKDDRRFAAYVLLATTGMRRGEVLGLRWSDVDFNGSQLAVSNTLTTVGASW